VGLATVSAEGDDRISIGRNLLEDGWVRAIMGADFVVFADRIKGDFRF
jgi:hypothetical protein